MTVTTLGYTMVICGNADDPQHRYRGRIEKVKFGVPIQEAFAHDIPATLLVLLLKVNKDGPSKKDIWRAPGNQAQVRKLSHIMQHGRLVNIANFSVYTAASVIKKFLSKLPGGIFGLENEQTLFDLFSQADAEKQRQIFCRVVYSLSVPSQHLLVLLFGTFYMISESSDVYGTKMTPDAIGISVAPSLFHTCIHDGQRAKMEDVMRFKIASEVISKIIQSFGYANLFPRECYEFYARITGRTLRVDDNDSRFRFAPPAIFPQCDAEHDVLLFGSPMRLNDRSRYECGCESGPSSSLRQPTVAYHRLSSSVGEVQVQSDFEEETHLSLKKDRLGESLESTHSLTYLEWVHERQTRRMRTRSEWFLSPALPTKNGVSSKSADFECDVASTSKHRATFDDDFMSSIEDITDTRSAVADSPQFNLNRHPLQPLRLQREQMSTHVSSPQTVRQPSEGDATKASRSVIRRRSWRTHYVRPNKSFDRSPPDANEDGSSRSTPVHRRYIASVQSASMPCSRRVSGGALAVSPAASSITSKMFASSISRSDEGNAKKSSTNTKFVHF